MTNETRPEFIKWIPLISEELIARIREHPKTLYQMHPRMFEELIATIFDKFGFVVELTQQTRDGGYDILAIRNTRTSEKYLIECKRYNPDNKVDVKIVRQLGGVVDRDQAFKGIIVTSSSFTKSAREEMSRTSWNLEGKDFNHVMKWVGEYDKLKMLNSIAGGAYVEKNGLFVSKPLL